MKIKNLILILIILFGFSLALPIYKISAQSPTPSPYHDLVEELNQEYDDVYMSYDKFVSKDTSTGDEKIYFNELVSNLNEWERILNSNLITYNKYISYDDKQISDVAVLAKSSATRALNAINLYRQALSSENSDLYSSFIKEGNSEFAEASRIRDEAVELYNNNSGFNSSNELRNILIGLTIVMAVITLVLFLKTGRSSLIDAEVVRSEIFKRLTKSALWMTIGLGITTGGFAYSLKNGGTYYILYGPILFGGWELLKGLRNYLQNDRQVLKGLALVERKDAIKRSFKDENSDKPNGVKKCPFCNFEQNKSAIICSSCGENIL